MRICMIGTGYVGLVTGSCFAENGNDVWCVDVNKQKIDALNEGHIPIYEPGLEEIVKRNTTQGRLHFTTNLKEGMGNALFIFIAVGTPPDSNGAADLSFVYNVAKEIGENLESYKIVVTKSTVPVGTTFKVKEIIAGNLLSVISLTWNSTSPSVRNSSKKVPQSMISKNRIELSLVRKTFGQRNSSKNSSIPLSSGIIA